MSTNVCSVISSRWSSSSTDSSTAIILPDGCRDVILKMQKGHKPYWLVSPLFDQASTVKLAADSTTVGFRLQPGVKISESELLRLIDKENLYVDQVENVIDDFSSLNSSVEEVLACLATDVNSIAQGAARLGVSSRTLQRLMLKETARSPSYWYQLARVRKAARSLTESMSLIDTAGLHRFSDQSHMSREFQRWFKLTPAELLTKPELVNQLDSSGYA